MRFSAIEVQNLLAYDGRAIVNFDAPTDPERNVTLIWGRNGKGKTSFLTALKILFTGLEEDQFRRVGLKKSGASQAQFVLGDGATWLGLINRRALDRARHTRTSETAQVAATWTEDGRQYRAERTWTTDGHTYEQRFTLYDGEQRLLNQPAEERLEELLPKDFVNFFFFDGEEVKQLAEGIGHRAVEVDRLMRITFVAELATTVNDIAEKRLRQNAKGGTREQLDELDRSLAKAKRDEAAAKEDLADMEHELAIARPDLARLQTRRENLGSGASEARREELESQRIDVRRQLTEAIEAIATQLPGPAPFYANMRLVSEALEAVDARLKDVGTAEVALLRTIKERIPAWLEGARTPLTPDQRTSLRQHLESELDRLRVASTGHSPLAKLEPERAERLRAMLLRWTIAGPSERDRHAGYLESAHKLQLKLEQLDDAIMRLEVGSQADLAEYRRVVADIADLDTRIEAWNQRVGQLTERAQDAAATIARLGDEQQKLFKRLEDADKGIAEGRFMQAAARTFTELTDQLRQQVKSKLETAINLRFGQLAGGDHLVARIALDETYTMIFQDVQGRRIGRASLSSGLKQLAATALLWAMKDVSGRDFPVVIDTPLGRIDRENQNNLLTNYYPKISPQTVVLPTNSEIDPSKLAILEPHVAANFLIENDGGDRATIQPNRALVQVA